MAAQLIGYFALSIGYGMFTEWYWRGQTIRKRLLRLRVVDAQGLKLNFNQIALRNLLRCVDLLPAFYALGGAVSLLNRQSQQLRRHRRRHDRDSQSGAARTGPRPARGR